MGMVGTICIGSVLVGAMILFGAGAGLPFRVRMAIASACAIAGLGGFYCHLASRKTHHIDISGIGQIRLVEDSALAARSFDNDSPSGESDGEIVSLMDDSTLWPCLLILRLKAENQGVKVVFVLPDSVEKSAFKALSVACRWISMRSDPVQVVTATKF